MVEFNLTLMRNRQLETERLLLRPVELSDAADMFEYASDGETTHYVFDRHKSLADTEENIAEFFLAEPAGKYGIELREKGKMIGTLSIRIKEPHQIAEIGYVLNKKYWGKGYATEAASALMELGFEQLGLEKVYALHDVENPASGKVMLRLGMQREGILRSHRLHKGQRVDVAYYGILKEEYDRNKLDK